MSRDFNKSYYLRNKIMQNIKDFFNTKDLFAKYVGVEITEVSPGMAKAVLKSEEKHMNGVRRIQGGAIFTLADTAFAAASNSHGTVAVAINAHISFLKGAGIGTLTAEAKEVSCNPKLAVYSISVTDETGDLIASFEGMVYRKKDKLME